MAATLKLGGPGAEHEGVSSQLLFRVATRPRLLPARPIQVVADIRASLFEFDAPCRITRLTPHHDGVTVTLGETVPRAAVEELGAQLALRYPDVNFVIKYLGTEQN